MAGLYPDCDTGAMAPFGSLYGQDVYMDDSLLADAEIVFHAGTHADAMRMRLADFMKLVNPVCGPFAEPMHRATLKSAFPDRARHLRPGNVSREPGDAETLRLPARPGKTTATPGIGQMTIADSCAAREVQLHVFCHPSRRRR